MRAQKILCMIEDPGIWGQPWRLVRLQKAEKLNSWKWNCCKNSTKPLSKVYKIGMVGGIRWSQSYKILLGNKSWTLCPIILVWGQNLKLVAQIYPKQYLILQIFVFSQTFYPKLPIFLHGYIRHIRDISQLWCWRRFSCQKRGETKMGANQVAVRRVGMFGTW